jgi:hypothetical protein
MRADALYQSLPAFLTAQIFIKILDDNWDGEKCGLTIVSLKDMAGIFRL